LVTRRRRAGAKRQKRGSMLARRYVIVLFTLSGIDGCAKKGEWENMKIHQLCGVIFLVAIAIVLGGTLACNNANPAPEGKEKSASNDAGKTLFENTCSKCHPAKKAENYAGADAWDSIVKRMAQKNNANISDENAGKIIAYLEAAYPRK